MAHKHKVVSVPLLFTALFWAFNFVAAKQVFQYTSPPSIALVRMVFTGVMIYLVARIRGQIFKFPREHTFRLLVNGVFALGVYMILFFEGVKRTSGTEASIILALSPIFINIFSVAAKHERFSLRVLVGAIIAFLGVVVVIEFGAPAAATASRLAGDLMLLTCSILWAWSIVIVRPVLKTITPYELFVLSIPSALLVLLPYGIKPAIATDWTALGFSGWAYFLHVSLLSGGAAFICFYEGVRQVGSTKAGFYQYLVPPGAALFTHLFLGEPFYLLQGVGVAIVIAGVALGSSYEAQARDGMMPVVEGG